MTAAEYFSVAYALGCDQAGSIAIWEENLDNWATEQEEEEKKREMEARRFDPNYRPTPEQAKGQASLMQLLPPAPAKGGE